jgi:hypothetical protein
MESFHELHGLVPFEPPSLHCAPGRPWLHLKLPQFLDFDFDADPDLTFDFKAVPAFHTEADPAPGRDPQHCKITLFLHLPQEQDFLLKKSIAVPGSGIRCLFDPWPGSGIRNRFIPDLGSRILNLYFLEPSDKFVGNKFQNSLKIGPNFFF